MSKQITKREVRFAVHLPRTEYREDAHYVKEHRTYSDGTEEPHTYLVKDFKRPIWVTKKAAQNHKEKKEFELLENLNVQNTTQSDLNRTVANLLDAPHLANKPAMLKESPYVYGYDQTSTSIIKLKSLTRNDNIQSSYSVAAFDIETNVHTKEILMATITYKGKSHTALMKSFIPGISDVLGSVRRGIAHYLPNYKDLGVSINVFESEVDLLKDVFKVANDWGPDFLAIWNMDFDISVIMERLEKYKVNPIDIICDTSIPRNYRYCRYKRGITKKVTASGVVKPINPSLQWHSLISTTKFYVIDSMCVYRQLRMAKQEMPSYSLDYILGHELGTSKLKFEKADAYKGEKWHIFMQERFPIEYIVYNIYDCLAMLELDDKVKDLTSSLPSFAAMTDFGRFNSNPKKIVDALFVFGLERGKVVGTVGKTEETVETIDEGDEEELDELDVKNNKTLGLDGWIQMLQQNLLLEDGLCIFEDFPDLKTNIRGLTFDSDCSSAYPSATLVANVSKETTNSEVITVHGMEERLFREMNLSVCLGPANMLEYNSVMFGLPPIDQMDQEIIKYL